MRRFLLAALTALLIACGGDDDAVDTVAPVSTDDPATTPPEDSPPSPSPSPTPTRTPTPTPTPTPIEPPGSSTPWSASPETVRIEPSPVTVPGVQLAHDHPLVTGAVDDLARRLGVEASDIAVVDARPVTWGDRSLGCPQPGMSYLQVLVDGTLVVLESGGRRFEYHGGDPLFLCENPKPPSGGG